MATDGFALADDPERAMRDAIARHPVGRMGKPGYRKCGALARL